MNKDRPVIPDTIAFSVSRVYQAGIADVLARIEKRWPRLSRSAGFCEALLEWLEADDERERQKQEGVDYRLTAYDHRVRDAERKRREQEASDAG